jgi:hypothetical protein
LFSPDELTSYWFVSHDFAGAMGLEFSRDAARELKKAIGPGRARIDYEADAVTVRISRKENVIPTLAAIYHRIGWDKSELDSITPQVMACKRPRPRKIAIGDVFLVPFAPERFGLGQVLDVNYKFPTVAVFTSVGTAEELAARPVSGCDALTILHIHGNALYKGQWPVIGSAPVKLDPAAGPGRKTGEVGSTTWGGDGPIVDLLGAFVGLRTWEEGYHDPNDLRKLVLLRQVQSEG